MAMNPPPIITLTQGGATWTLALDGVIIATIPGGNTWRVRRDAFTALADQHDTLVIWEERRNPELGYIGQPFHRDPCDDGCPLGPRGHATVLVLGNPDDTCANFRRAQRALDLAHDRAGMDRLPHIATAGE